ncbi:MAG: hypothetical protein AAF191_17145 [Verrucomicrobiota bacterium]
MERSPDYATLKVLLNSRLDVIADHQLRDRDPDAHLAKLAEVSHAIMDWPKDGPKLPFQLKHFLENCSFDKALAWIESHDS